MMFKDEWLLPSDTLILSIKLGKPESRRVTSKTRKKSLSTIHFCVLRNAEDRDLGTCRCQIVTRQVTKSYENFCNSIGNLNYTYKCLHKYHCKCNYFMLCYKIAISVRRANNV